MASIQISGPGLTDDQIQAERAWLQQFVQAGDTLDWSKWEKYWAEDAFLQWANKPRIQGKSAIAEYFQQELVNLEYMLHELTRVTIDVNLGLVYQTSNVSFKIKGDPKGRTIQLPGIGILHKRVGEGTLAGCEVYIDQAPLTAVALELIGDKRE